MMLTFAQPAGLLLLLMVPALLYLTLRSHRAMRARRMYTALGVRILLVMLLAMALAEPRLRGAADRLSVAFLVDLSDSVGGAAEDRALRFVADAIGTMPGGDRAAIVTFGREPLVERASSEARDITEFASVPDRSATDLAAALRVGLGVLPTDGARRLVVLSDGNENLGQAREEARVPASLRVPIDHVVLGEERGVEVALRSVEAPGALRGGDTFALRLNIDATVATSARVTLITDGRVDEGAAGLTAPIPLQVGANGIVIPHDPLPPGFHTFRVQIEPVLDTVAENNDATAFTIVSGRARVLLVESVPGQAAFLRDALQAGGIETLVVAPNALPSDLATLRENDAVVLVNLPASDFSAPQIAALKNYVQTLGGGLVIVGGDRSLALGGYQRTPLEEISPLSMQRRGTRATSSVAMVLAIDVSGSMGESVGGMSKLDLAKEAASSTLELITQSDRLGIVVFDEQPRILRQLSELLDPEGAIREIRTMATGGGTAIYPALAVAHEQLQSSDSRVRHIVLLTDGISPAGDYEGLAERLRRDAITLSTIGIGNDADVTFLRDLAARGNGRFYEGSDAMELPQILVKETLEVARTAIVEEPFQPIIVGSSPILDGFAPASLPDLRGYVAVTPKPASLVVLGSRQGDAILAEWQYGLGQVIAWTSDVQNRWAADWIEWSEFSRFWSQVVKRAVPARIDHNVQASVAFAGAGARIEVDALHDDRSFRNDLTVRASLVPVTGSPHQIQLAQVGPGRYEAPAPIALDVPHLIQVAAYDAAGNLVAAPTTGFTRGAAAEYAQLRPNPASLAALSAQTGGRLLTAPVEAFRHDLVAPGAGLDLRPWLLALAIPVFLADVAVRRLRVSFGAVERVLARIRVLPTARVPVPLAQSKLAGLLASRTRGAKSPAGTRLASHLAGARRDRRAETRTAPPIAQDASARAIPRRPTGRIAAGPAAAPPRRDPPSAPVTSGGAAPTSTAARLLAAKRRASV